MNTRLADSTPIPATTLKHLALKANILPSIFNAKTQQMWLGRTRRTASEAQRMALIARDEHCIGCKANPLWCRTHHIPSGPTTDAPTSTTCYWYATHATKRSTSTARKHINTRSPRNSTSNPHPNPTAESSLSRPRRLLVTDAQQRRSRMQRPTTEAPAAATRNGEPALSEFGHRQPTTPKRPPRLLVSEGFGGRQAHRHTRSRKKARCI